MRKRDMEMWRERMTDRQGRQIDRLSVQALIDMR